MFGWEYKQNTDLEGVEYDGILTPAAPVPTGGVLGTAGKIEEYATFYVLVEDVPAAIEKAKEFNFSLKNAVMASDAFFPFPDCVEIANNEGITDVIQPGGSIKDELSIEYCNTHKMAMVFTSIRHFKH